MKSLPADPSLPWRRTWIAAIAIATMVLCVMNGEQLIASFGAVPVTLPVWVVFVVVGVLMLVRLDLFRSTRSRRRLLAPAVVSGGTVAVVLGVVGDQLLDTNWSAILPSDAAERWSAALSAPLAE
ncbi:hypothetical protein [Rhodococcus sp. O3]|uniref:hypothetical protein n=1 Tax=Rhodococcus sp. O3 TaxID=3404919 RepID=UPI003B67B813